ncbi:hypothetical protein L6452_34642 [Arctium lappa]|uniref:Uncharacterized protein n=1 Tax=Arctium lappa TaxID=4217 RepID=A0ACB8YIT6_ARCLA|nr:hypothetical protein L6452_34642 [Arctium lappa]
MMPPSATSAEAMKRHRTVFVVEKTTLQTKATLEKIVNVRLSAAQPKNVQTQSQNSKFIKYKPSQQSAAFNSGAKERINRMVEMPVDPLDLPKLEIPPCISNWKNLKGYTIPLDKHLAADGRGLQEVQINDNFAKLSEALYVAEQKAREAVAMRSKVQKEMMMKEKKRKEQELSALAQKARSERTGVVPHGCCCREEVDDVRRWLPFSNLEIPIGAEHLVGIITRLHFSTSLSFFLFLFLFNPFWD